MLNKIMLPADADAQRARLTSAGTVLTGHLAETGSAGSGLVVRIRPWHFSAPVKTSGVTPGRYAASISFTRARNALITAQPSAANTSAANTSAANTGAANTSAANTSTAASSGLCAMKQDQEKARSAAAIGGALGPLPPRDPV
jgi:hypothetical protein